MSCFRERRKGCRTRKSVRGCIVGPDLATLNLVILKKGAEEIEGLTDDMKPRRLGPKRASNIRKLFNLEKKDNVCNFVVRREVELKSGRKKQKAPKIQRFVKSRTLQRKRYKKAQVRNRMIRSHKMEADYKKRCMEYNRMIRSHQMEAD